MFFQAILHSVSRNVILNYYKHYPVCDIFLQKLLKILKKVFFGIVKMASFSIKIHRLFI